MKKFLIKAGIAAALMCVVCVAVFFATKKHYENRTVVVEKKVLVETEKEVTSEVISSALSNIGEIATGEYSYTIVESYDESKSINGYEIPFTTSKFTYSYDGIIKAGIDFTKVEVNKDDDKKLITIKLPKAEILSSELDENSFELYDEKNSIFNPISVGDINASLINLKEKARQKAISKGILELADENAEEMIKNLIKGLVDDNSYKISFETVE